MSEPWLSIIGIGEDGLEGLPPASRAALDRAEIVFGGPRHLELAGVGTRGQAWPVPFSTAPVLAERGRKTAVLASGDPFWHGAGGSLVGDLTPGEWQSFPAPSTFSLAANRLGWRLEEVTCLGLHAAPLPRLRPHLARGQRLIVTLRDETAVGETAAWLIAEGFGASTLHILEALGGPRERITTSRADALRLRPIATPVALAIDATGQGLPHAPGLPDDLYDHYGQITKSPIRALTLSALSPRPGDVLWDIGTGSGSIAIEFLLAAPASRAFGVEANPTRAARARANAARFGVEHRFHVTEAAAPLGLSDLPAPDAVFIGGGASAELLEAILPRLPQGGRLVANAVTLETEALLYDAQSRHGGSLLRIDLAQMAPLGRKRGWEVARPIIQWSVTL